MDKIINNAAEAVADIPTGASIAVGGFGLCGIPMVLIEAVEESGINDLEIISNNAGIEGVGLGRLLDSHQVRRVVASYVGENGEFARQYVSGELELELTPQGTLAERLQAGGTGIPAFYTPAGAGTLVAEGGLPLRYDENGNPSVLSEPKPTAKFDVFGEETEYVLEKALVPDFSLVRAAKADKFGNVQFHRAARNFNPVVAMAGQITIVEAEEIVDVGALDPDEIHLPGIFVHRVVPLTPEQAADKRIEKLVTRQREEA
ncbi:CoA transferase subunit A [Corynebacterium sp. S7]